MMLFFETGVRVNEMTYIKKEHLQFEHNHILITNTKGYKQRFVPMQEDMQKQFLENVIALLNNLIVNYGESLLLKNSSYLLTIGI